MTDMVINSGPTRWWIAATVFGLLTAVFSAILLGVFPDTTAASSPGYGGPVMAFEMARTQADLEAVFGVESDPMQIARLVAMRSGNEQDFVFMLLYAAFLGSAAMAFRHEVPRRIMIIPVALAFVAAGADAYENILLADIQAQFAAGSFSEALNRVAWPVWFKFFALTFINLIFGWAMIRLGSVWLWIGRAMMALSLTTLLAWAIPSWFGWTMVLAQALSWLALLVLSGSGTALLFAYRRSLAFYAPVVEVRPVIAASILPDIGDNPDEPDVRITAKAPPSAAFGRRAPWEKTARVRKRFRPDALPGELPPES